MPYVSLATLTLKPKISQNADFPAFPPALSWNRDRYETGE